jgi:fluoride ion exporter CrcB/FEX
MMAVMRRPILGVVLSDAARPGAKSGGCEGFTTFSTFSLDSVVLMQCGEMGPAAAYVIGSVAVRRGAVRRAGAIIATDFALT